MEDEQSEANIEESAVDLDQIIIEEKLDTDMKL